MGAVADAVGGALGAVLDPIKEIGHIAESVVREVGHAAESVGREAGKIGQAAVNDPVGTLAKVAAIATQQYWALPLISAATVMAHGGDLGQAALAAGVSYVGGAIAAGVGDYLGAGATGAVDMMSADAVDLASQGLTAGQITDILQQSYGVSSDIATQTAVQSVIGTSASEIASNITSQMTTQNMLSAAAGNSLGGAARAALSGGSGDQILMAGLTSGVGSLAGSAATSGMKDLGMNNTVANVLGKATGAAAASTVAGKDAKLSFINALINTTLTESGKQVGSALKGAWNEVNDSVTKYNDQLNKNKETYETTLTPLEQEARAAQEAAAAAFDNYKPIRDQFSDLVKKYDDAKAAGDTALANQYADEANALIPSLNDATTAYNDLSNTYDTKLANYQSAADQFTAENKKLEEIKTEYEARNANLQKATAELTEAGIKVADMKPEAKLAFEQLYNDGNSVSTSLDTVKNVNELTDVARGSFMRQYQQNQDPAASLEFAQKINSLDTNSQASYAYAVNTGLEDTAALQYAPNLSAMSKESQQIFLDGIKSGQDPKAAETTAALAEFFKQYQTQQAPTTSYAPTAGANTTGSMTDVGGGASTPLVPVETGVLPNTTFLYNPTTGKFDIPVADTAGGTSGSTSLAPTESTATGVTPFTPEQKAAADALDAQLDKGEITKEQYDARAKSIEEGVGLGTTGAGTGTNAITNALNTPNLADNAFTGTAPSGGTTGAAPSSPIATTTPSTTTGTGPVTGGAAPSTGVTGTAPIGGSSSTGTAETGGTSGTGTGTGAGGTGTGTGGGGTGTGTGGGGIGGIGIGIGGAGTGGYNYGYSTSGSSSDAYGGIKNLTPGLTQKMDYTLSGMPVIQESASPVPSFATGSLVSSDPFNTGIGNTNSDNTNGISGALTPGMTKAQLGYVLTGLPGSNIVAKAEGGSIEEHNPSFYSEGGLSSIENRYVQGEGDGTSDSVAAMLANGEFVIPADVVSKLGNGSNEAGASVLDQFLKTVRTDANSNGDKLPPKSKGPLAYLLDAKRKVKA